MSPGKPRSTTTVQTWTSLDLLLTFSGSSTIVSLFLSFKCVGIGDVVIGVVAVVAVVITVVVAVIGAIAAFVSSSSPVTADATFG